MYEYQAGHGGIERGMLFVNDDEKTKWSLPRHMYPLSYPCFCMKFLHFILYITIQSVVVYTYTLDPAGLPFAPISYFS